MLASAMTKQLDGGAGGFADATGEDTVELELDREQMISLSRADTPFQPSTVPAPIKAKSLPSLPKNQRAGWPALILRVSAASVLSGGIAYLATSPAQPVDVGANTVVSAVAPMIPALVPAPPAANSAPVRFTNPFDVAEVFEFPSGTSETEARRTVADVLLQRAHDRQNSWKNTHQGRNTADQVVAGTNSSRTVM